MTLASSNFRLSTHALRSGVQMSRLPSAALQAIVGERPRLRDGIRYSFPFFTRLCEKARALFARGKTVALAANAGSAKGLD